MNLIKTIFIRVKKNVFKTSNIYTYIHMKTTQVIILFLLISLLLKRMLFNQVYIIEYRETKLNLSFYTPLSLRMIRL